MKNDFAIFYQLPNHPGTFITVPSDQVDAEVQRLESEGAQVTAVIRIFDFVNFE
jgi:hypothetical protein